MFGINRENNKNSNTNLSFEADKIWFHDEAANHCYKMAAGVGANLPGTILGAIDLSTVATSLALRSVLKLPCWISFKAYDITKYLFSESSPNKCCADVESCASWVKSGYDWTAKGIMALEKGEYATTSLIRDGMKRANERLTDLIFGDKAKNSFTVGEFMSAGLMIGFFSYTAYKLGKRAIDHWKIVILGKKVYFDQFDDFNSGTRINYHVEDKRPRSSSFGHASITTLAAVGCCYFSIFATQGMANHLAFITDNR